MKERRRRRRWWRTFGLADNQYVMIKARTSATFIVLRAETKKEREKSKPLASIFFPSYWSKRVCVCVWSTIEVNCFFLRQLRVTHDGRHVILPRDWLVWSVAKKAFFFSSVCRSVLIAFDRPLLSTFNDVNGLFIPRRRRRKKTERKINRVSPTYGLWVL